MVFWFKRLEFKKKKKRISWGLEWFSFWGGPGT
jgi:hypothetical protein